PSAGSSVPMCNPGERRVPLPVPANTLTGGDIPDFWHNLGYVPALPATGRLPAPVTGTPVGTNGRSWYGLALARPGRPRRTQMSSKTTTTLAELPSLKGQQIGVSEWFEVTQDRVNTFADATNDHQWIHVDPERAAAESPFGGPIGHGFLTLSLFVP